uniref:Uncharacterized protein n=1 Tax=Peronospora matthiolae TaxID=2874970 RepID=A0AAV1TH04_9STRA
MRNYKGFDAVDVHLADDGIVQAIGSGDIVMSMKTPQGMKKGVLTNVAHPKVIQKPVLGRPLHQGCRPSDVHEGWVLWRSERDQVENWCP